MGKNNFTKKIEKKPDFTKFFFFIFRAIVPHCSERVSYKLIDITKSMTFPVVVKRSVDQPQKEFQFVEFGGKGFIKYNIVNMNEI